MSRSTFRYLSIVLLVLGCALPALSQRARATKPQAQASNPQAQTNLALNKRVTASSSDEQASWGARFIVDGQRDERSGSRGWSSSADKSRNHTEWVQVDLGGNQSVGFVDIYPRNDPARLGEGFPVDFTIETSEDGRAWTAVVGKTNYGKPGNEVQRFAFNQVGARYVRVVGTNLRYLGAEQAYYMQFAEIEIFGASSEPSGPAGLAGLAGTSWQGDIRLDDGSTRSLTVLIDGANQVSGEIVSSATRVNVTPLALQGTYDPSTGAFALRFSGREGRGTVQGTLTGAAQSPTAASGQAALTIMQSGSRQIVNGTWRIARQ
jgi:hypothetical protein